MPPDGGRTEIKSLWFPAFPHARGANPVESLDTRRIGKVTVELPFGVAETVPVEFGRGFVENT